jgi:hypothetical protein
MTSTATGREHLHQELISETVKDMLKTFGEWLETASFKQEREVFKCVDDQMEENFKPLKAELRSYIRVCDISMVSKALINKWL